jgi:hypothetical protein
MIQGLMQLSDHSQRPTSYTNALISIDQIIIDINLNVLGCTCLSIHVFLNQLHSASHCISLKLQLHNPLANLRHKAPCSISHT